MLRILRRELGDLEGRIAELERRLVESWLGEVLAELRRAVSLYEEASLREVCFFGEKCTGMPLRLGLTILAKGPSPGLLAGTVLPSRLADSADADSIEPCCFARLNFGSC
ncbi:hypothetical protein NDU88_002244 [Pleurodeles waltl]|uniref:Uncharacterized protein n=1 Tax=Pleurodeles waltl TaxID=8319 RepID=A0AAV7P693_PLEWA|nr:hypothetical protein NDU88_002244 [Pleurodeles waltl]